MIKKIKIQKQGVLDEAFPEDLAAKKKNMLRVLY